MKSIVIDVHAHFTPSLILERFAAHAAKFPGVTLTRGDKGSGLAFPGDGAPRAIMPRLWHLIEDAHEKQA